MKRSNLILVFIGSISIGAGIVSFRMQKRFTGVLFCYTTGPTKRPIINLRYTTCEDGETLICTIPGPRAYISRVVCADL